VCGVGGVGGLVAPPPPPNPPHPNPQSPIPNPHPHIYNLNHIVKIIILKYLLKIIFLLI